jgi:hypothetical protein
MPFRVLLVALGLTWLIEWGAVAVMLRRASLAMALAVLLINALTQPLAMAAYLELGIGFWPIELVVCLVEIPLYRLLLRVPWPRAGAISLVANALSGAASFVLESP